MEKKIFVVLFVFFTFCAFLATVLYNNSDLTKKDVTPEIFEHPVKSTIPGYETVSEAKLFSLNADVEKLIYFNDRLYGKANSFDEIEGDLLIHEELTKLIESGYVPKNNGETNTKEFIGGYVLRASEGDLVLKLNNRLEYFIVISKY